MYGGQATIFGCTSTGDCLKTRNRTVTVSQNNSLNQRVQNMIKNISDKLVSDDPLTSQEKGLLKAPVCPFCVTWWTRRC